MRAHGTFGNVKVDWSAILIFWRMFEAIDVTTSTPQFKSLSMGKSLPRKPTRLISVDNRGFMICLDGRSDAKRLENGWIAVLAALNNSWMTWIDKKVNLWGKYITCLVEPQSSPCQRETNANSGRVEKLFGRRTIEAQTHSPIHQPYQRISQDDAGTTSGARFSRMRDLS